MLSHRPSTFKARLDGFQEVPAISTTGSGSFRAKLRSDGTTLEFELSYSGLNGTATAAHIHLGQIGVNGGVITFLCDIVVGNAIPNCPATSGTVTGIITSANVTGPSGQGISAGEFGELLTAMRDGVTYVNVHTTVFPGGNIRGQINR